MESIMNRYQSKEIKHIKNIYKADKKQITDTNKEIDVRFVLLPKQHQGKDYGYDQRSALCRE